VAGVCRRKRGLGHGVASACRATRLAQRTESACITGRFRWEHPGLFITTIHDFIMTTAGDEETVRGVMLEEFARLGVYPKVRVER
jgi:hypothetical protein